MKELDLNYALRDSSATQELHDFNITDGSAILCYLETSRTEVSKRLEKSKRAELGQFVTPVSIAYLMACMFDAVTNDDVFIIDPGSGIGTLFAALILRLCAEPTRLKKVRVTAYEIEPLFFPYLDNTIRLCKDLCERRGIVLDVVINQEISSLQQYLCCIRNH